MQITMILILSMVLFMSGCSNSMTTTTTAPDGTQTVTSQPASIFGKSDYDTFGIIYENFGKFKTALMASCNAPVGPNPSDMDRMGAHFEAMACKLEVANMRFEVVAPETWAGVVKEGMHQTPLGLAIAEGASVAKTGIKGAGSAISGNAQVTNSLNHTDSTAVATGTYTSATSPSTGTAPPTVVEQPAPVIVPAP